MRDDEEDRDRPTLSFTLPSITVPPFRLPERFYVVLPPKMRRRERESGLLSHLLLALLVDLIDAALALSAAPLGVDLARVLGGGVVVFLLVGTPGLLYAWEGVAVLFGFARLTAVPTATLLVSARALR